MAKFAKLIEVDENQVLLTVSFNDENDSWETKVSSMFDNMTVGLTLGYDSQEKADEYMKNFTFEDAVNFRKAIIEKYM